MSLSPLKIRHCDHAVLNNGLVPWIRRGPELVIVLNPIKETPLVIVVEEQVFGKIVDEPLVLDEQLV
ncbi:hypothetical protein Tco_0370985 [Tanacetum coccineum]